MNLCTRLRDRQTPLQVMKFVAPPECPSMPWTDLKAGDAILLHGTEIIGGMIQDCTWSPWSHVAMVVKDPATGTLWVAEMTWPKLRMTPIREWLASESSIYALQIKSRVTDEQSKSLWNFWASRVGLAYDVGLLLALAPELVWQRFATKCHLPLWMRRIPLAKLNGVCSVNVAMAYAAAGWPCPWPISTVTPEDVEHMPWLGPVEQVTI